MTPPPCENCGLCCNFKNILMTLHNRTFLLAYTITEQNRSTKYELKVAPSGGNKRGCILPMG